MSLLNDVTLVLLICHVLGDFHFQSQNISDRKTKSLKALATHLSIHAITLLSSFLLLFSWGGILENWGLLLSVLISHILLDVMKFYLYQAKDLPEEILYIVDQVLHIGLLLVFNEFVFQSTTVLLFFNRNQINWLLLLLVITKPANITFKVVFQKYQFQNDAPTVPGAGAVIGNLERILSAVFLAMNQVASIGFIYTAKSIARFKEIEENKGFAEYYLIGTLFSILYVVVAYYLIMIA